tara:strand:+ start:2068 stop:2544 length:477 start_codon:yes stop_codon:yes gene_type:complete
MTEPVIIGIGSTKWVKDANTIAKTLYFPATSGTHSLHDDTGVDYSVPVGKKFIIISIDTGASAGSANGYGSPIYTHTRTGCNVWKNATTDTITGGTQVFSSYGGDWTWRQAYTTGLTRSVPPNPHSETFINLAAGDFVIGEAATSFTSITVYGIETNV